MPRPALIVDYRTPEDERRELRALGFHVVLSEEVPFLYDAVRGHPDLQFVKACGTLICHQGLSEGKAKELSALGTPVLRSGRPLGFPYPGHIILNAAISDDLLVHRLEDTDPVLLASCPALRRINVRQGYTRCSLAWVGKDSYVTSDPGILRALEALGKDVLHLPYGDVLLEGFDHGFIGGCLSRIELRSETLLLVTGDLSCYRYGDRLKGFLRNVGIHPCAIGSGTLKDRGTVIQV